MPTRGRKEAVRWDSAGVMEHQIVASGRECGNPSGLPCHGKEILVARGGHPPHCSEVDENKGVARIAFRKRLKRKEMGEVDEFQNGKKLGRKRGRRDTERKESQNHKT